MQPVEENYANPNTCLFHVLFKVHFVSCVYIISTFFSIRQWQLLVLKSVTFFVFCVWQAAALAFYILSTLFIDNFVIIFVITVLLAALDFWVVKNVSGRILVGLRWWNEINDLGESVWRFECLDQEVRIACLLSCNLHVVIIFF